MAHCEEAEQAPNARSTDSTEAVRDPGCWAGLKVPTCVHKSQGRRAPLGAGRGASKEPRVFVLLCPQQLQSSLLPHQDHRAAAAREGPRPPPAPAAPPSSGRSRVGGRGRSLALRAAPAPPRAETAGSQAGAPSLGRRRMGLGGFRGSGPGSGARHLCRAPPAGPEPFRVARGLQACVDEAPPAPPRRRAPPTPGRRRGRGGRGANGRGGAQAGWPMGVGSGRAVRPWEPIGGRGAGPSGCGPMQWRAGARPRRWRRQVAAAPGSGKQPVRVWVPEASGRPGEPRRDPGPPACGARPRAATPTEGRGLGRRGGRAAPAAAPRRRRRPGVGGERRGWRERPGRCSPRRGPPRSGSVAPEGPEWRGSGVPMAAGSRVFVRAPLGARARRPVGGAVPLEPGAWEGRKCWIWLMIRLVPGEWGGARGGWSVGELQSAPGGHPGYPLGGLVVPPPPQCMTCARG